MALTDVAEAQRPRSSVERRLRPGRGFWDNSSSYRTRSYNGYSNGTRYYYTPQQQSTPQQQYVMPQQQYTPYRYYVQPHRYVQPRTYVQQPQTTVPAQTATPTPKPNATSQDTQTGE